jgi:hypothetical protein
MVDGAVLIGGGEQLREQFRVVLLVKRGQAAKIGSVDERRAQNGGDSAVWAVPRWALLRTSREPGAVHSTLPQMPSFALRRRECSRAPERPRRAGRPGRWHGSRQPRRRRRSAVYSLRSRPPRRRRGKARGRRHCGSRPAAADAPSRARPRSRAGRPRRTARRRRKLRREVRREGHGDASAHLAGRSPPSRVAEFGHPGPIRARLAPAQAGATCATLMLSRDRVKVVVAVASLWRSRQMTPAAFVVMFSPQLPGGRTP